MHDLIVVGAGPGGYVAAIRAAQLGLKTAIVERESLGGVCLNWGCIPTKALLRNAEIAELLHHGDKYGFSFDNLTLDFSKAIERSQSVVSLQTKGIGFLMKKNKIDVLTGSATITRPGKVEVGGQTHPTKRILLATGAQTRLLPGVAVDGKRIFTAREAVARTDLPPRLVILGGGPIGVEFAYVYHHYGSQVTLVEGKDRLVPQEDEEISQLLGKIYAQKGIKVLTSSMVKEIQTTADGVTVQVETARGDQTIQADACLMAIGIVPNTQDIDMKRLGIQTDERGYIVIDDQCKTTAADVWAIGDVTGKLPLAHVASMQGIVAVEAMTGHTPPVLNYQDLPRATYCRPQIASLGLTESQAKAKGHQVAVGKCPFRPVGKAQALGETDGFVKLVADAQYGEILGVHMIGPDVSELLAEVGVAKTLEGTLAEIDLTVHAHPTLSEAVKEAALAALGRPIHI